MCFSLNMKIKKICIILKEILVIFQAVIELREG